MDNFKDFYEEELTHNIDNSVLDKYKILDCLHETDHSSVYLIVHKTTKIKYILKTYKTSFQEREYKMLSTLNHKAIPKIIDANKADDNAYIIEEYFDGSTIAQAKDLNSRQIIKILTELCEILSYIHSQNPPVIHRDIKPENIIITPENHVKLIDFGSARNNKNTQVHDTVLLGTKGYASPEQYGFMETDITSDIYSLGVTIKELYKNNNITIAKNIASILDKCLQFDPTKRYKTAEEILNDINKKHIKIKFIITSAVFAFLMFFLMFNKDPSSKTYVFKSELIGQAVAEYLDKEIDKITIEDLKNIEALSIYGNRIASSKDEIIIESTENNYVSAVIINGKKDRKRGTIAELDDLKYMENLYTLTLMKQNIVDLSPIENLKIVHLHLNDNKISDLKPLKNYSQLYTLEIGGNPVDDFSSIENMDNLGEIDFSDTGIQDFSVIADKVKLKYVILKHLKIDTIEFITQLKELQALNLENNSINDLKAITGLKNLDYLNISSNPTTDIESLNTSYVNNVVINNTRINKELVNMEINVLKGE